MNSEPKIPTLLGISILLIGTVVGVFAASQTQIFQTQASPNQAPFNITVANLSQNSAAIFWETNEPASGFIELQSNTIEATFKDDRDSQTPQPHTLHFVTLNNLTPSTRFDFRINSDGEKYPKDTPLEFSTPISIADSDYQPIIGTIADNNLLPVREALIKLEIPGAQSLLTISKTSGNFILPLVKLKNQALTTNFKFGSQKTDATLTILTPNQTSKVKLKLPLDKPNLPPITLGQNYDFTTPESIKDKILGAKTTNLSSIEIIDKYDLNSDGVVDNLDLELVEQNISKKSAKYDFNADKKVDLLDIDTFKQLLDQ